MLTNGSYSGFTMEGDCSLSVFPSQRREALANGSPPIPRDAPVCSDNSIFASVDTSVFSVRHVRNVERLGGNVPSTRRKCSVLSTAMSNVSMGMSHRHGRNFERHGDYVASSSRQCRACRWVRRGHFSRETFVFCLCSPRGNQMNQ